MSNQFVDRRMQNDKNDDGKISKDEMPERMLRLLERADENGDEALDRKELQVISRQFADRMRQGGGDRYRGGRGGDDRGPGGDTGRRPERPDFE